MVTADQERAIDTLPWVADGVSGNHELSTYQTLRDLALLSPDVFWAWMERFGDGNDHNIAGSILERTVAIAGGNEATALRILRMHFLDTFEFEDFEAMYLLSDVVNSEPYKVEWILSHQSLSDGITDDNVNYVHLLYVEVSNTDAAATLRAMPWLEDALKSRAPRDDESIFGYDPSLEAMGILTALIGVYSRGEREFFLSMIDKAWFHDGISPLESSAIHNLLRIRSPDMTAAAHILKMPFLDNLTPDDAKILEALVELSRQGGLSQVLSHPSLAGGISDEGRGLFALAHLESLEPQAAQAIKGLPWVADGVGAPEQDSVWAFYILALEARQLLWLVMQKAWIQDGLAVPEISVIGALTAMSSTSNAASNPATALRIVQMPFLDSVEPTDAAAVDSLLTLAFGTSHDLLSPTLSNPALSGGITDEQAAVVSVLGSAVSRNPTLLDTLLDPGQVNVVKRTIALPLAGEVVLAVVSVRSDALSAMDLLEHAVRHHEMYMATPLPKSYVAPLVADIGGGGFGGPTGILIIDAGHEQPGQVIAHEAAHMYWAFAPRWLQEGPAVFFERASENSRIGEPLEGYSTSCQDTFSLAVLEREAPEDSFCFYALGWALFYDLYDRLGEERFRQGLSNLYLTLKAEHVTTVSECSGITRGQCSVKAAFAGDADPAVTAVVNEVVDRWYHGPDGAP